MDLIDCSVHLSAELILVKQ